MSVPQIDPQTLTEGLSSPFWQWFAAHVEQEWGAAGQRYQQAVQHAAEKADNDQAVHMLRMVIFAQKEIRTLLMAPQERLRAAREAIPKPPSASRRGPGL